VVNVVGALSIGATTGLIYAVTVMVCALVAVFAPTQTRRRAAREALWLLLFRDKKDR
jgi:hypothetical protein